MSPFNDGMAAAAVVELSEMGETILIDGIPASAIYDPIRSQDRQTDSAGKLMNISTTLYIQTAEWQRVGGKQGSDVDIDGNRGRVSLVTDLAGGQLAVAVGPQNPRQESGIPGF